MKEYFKAVPITTIIIVYLYTCGSLYLIAYWSTFDLDISNIATITDIPKSFIMPFVIGNAYNLINTVTRLIAFRDMDDDTVINYDKIKSRWGRFFLYFIKADVLLLLFAGLIFAGYSFYYMYRFYWFLSAYIISTLIVIILSRLTFMKQWIPKAFPRYYFLELLIAVPLLCVAIGKTKALNIFENKQSKYVRIDANYNDETDVSLKLLGFLGDKLIVSSIDNKKILIINQSTLRTVEILDSLKKTVHSDSIKKPKLATSFQNKDSTLDGQK